MLYPEKRKKFNKAFIKKLKQVYNNKCNYCNSTESLTIDHIQPLNKGGTNEIDNLQILCNICNHRKGDLFKKIIN
jgi:5-methylcytosine-specific restriction endonuclease McrA